MTAHDPKLPLTLRNAEKSDLVEDWQKVVAAKPSGTTTSTGPFGSKDVNVDDA